MAAPSRPAAAPTARNGSCAAQNCTVFEDSESDVTPNTNNCSALPWSDTPVQTPDPSAPSGGPSPGCFHHTRGAALMCLCLHVPGPSYFWLCESSCFSLGLSCSLLGRNTKSAIPHALSWLADSYCSILNTTIQKQLFQS